MPENIDDIVVRLNALIAKTEMIQGKRPPPRDPPPLPPEPEPQTAEVLGPPIPDAPALEVSDPQPLAAPPETQSPASFFEPPSALPAPKDPPMTVEPEVIAPDLPAVETPEQEQVNNEPQTQDFEISEAPLDTLAVATEPSSASEIPVAPEPVVMASPPTVPAEFPMSPPEQKVAMPEPVSEFPPETVTKPEVPAELKPEQTRAKAEPIPPVQNSARLEFVAPDPTPLAVTTDPPQAARLPFVFSEDEDFEIPFLIGCPEHLAKIGVELQEHLERLKPKFTKMKFHLRAKGFLPFSLEDARQSGIQRLQEIKGGVLILITTRRLSQKSPDPLAVEMARRGLYFQEVLVEAVAKKAFYFDFLLGLVFFLKSQKSGNNDDDREESHSVEWIGKRKI